MTPSERGSKAFEEIRTLHEHLNRALVSGEELSADEIAEFFSLAFRKAPEVVSTVERDELRYLMRLWASYLVVRGGAMPDLDIDVPELSQPPSEVLEPLASPLQEATRLPPRVSSGRRAVASGEPRRRARGTHDRLNSENLFLEHLGWIDKAAATVCAKHGVWGAEAEDFAGWIRMKLMEDEYAVFWKFRGESELKTYIATVVVRQFHEYGRWLRVRWSPSQAAKRLGPPAPQLEALVYRDGYRLEQAGEMLRTAGRTTLSDRELARLLARLPARGPMRPVEVSSEPALAGIEDASRADERIAAAKADELRGQVLEALSRAVGRLDPEDLTIMRMHLADGRTLADVSRALHLEQKPLYRRVDRLRRKMRELLAEEGVREDDVRAMLGDGEAP